MCVSNLWLRALLRAPLPLSTLGGTSVSTFCSRGARPETADHALWTMRRLVS